MEKHVLKDDRFTAIEYEPRSALAQQYKPETRAIREEFGTGYDVEQIREQLKDAISYKEKVKLDEFEGRKIPFTPKMAEKAGDFGTELGIELELSKEYGSGLGPTWVKQTFDLEEYSEKEYEVPLNELLPKPIERDQLISDAFGTNWFLPTAKGGKADPRKKATALAEVSSLLGEAQRRKRDELVQTPVYTDEYKQALGSISKSVIATRDPAIAEEILAPFQVQEYEAEMPMYRARTGFEAKAKSSLMYMPPKLLTGILSIPSIIYFPEEAATGFFGYKQKVSVVDYEAGIAGGVVGDEIAARESFIKKKDKSYMYGEDMATPYKELAKDIKTKGISKIEGATIQKDFNYIEKREGDLIDQMGKAYREDPTQFGIDVALSLVLFTGGTAVISKLGKYGSKASSGIVVAVQPIEQLFTKLATVSLGEKWIRKYGTPDVEEQIVRLTKGRLTGERRKTQVRLELERETKVDAAKIAEMEQAYEYKPQIKIKPEVELDTELSKSKINLETEVELENKIKLETEVELEKRIERETEVEVETETEVETEVEVEVEVEVEAEVETEVETEVEVEVETEVEIEPLRLPLPKFEPLKGSKKKMDVDFEGWARELNFEVGDLSTELSKIDKDLNKLMKNL